MSVLKNWLIILCLLPLTSFAENPITHKSIEDLVLNIEESAKMQNVDQLVTHFSKDVKVTFEFSESQGRRLELDLLGYKELLRQGWSMPMKFGYQIDDVVISISDDGESAVVTDVITETVTMDGEIIMSTRTHEKINIVNIDGSPLITQVYGLVSIDAQDKPTI